MFRSFNRCFPWFFVLVLRVSSTRTRTRRYGIEYEYEYHFIEYEYDKSQNSAPSKANGEEVALFACFGVSIDVFPGFSYSYSALAVLVLEDTASSTSTRIYLVKANGGNSLVDEVISVFKPEAPFLAYFPFRRSGPGSPSPWSFCAAVG